MVRGEIPELDVAGLRRFGLLLGSLLAGVFGLLLPWLGEGLVPDLMWLAAGVITVVWALTAPASLRGFYRAWMRVAMAIGSVVNSIILGVVFFLVLTPIGVLMRLLGKDPLRRRWDARAASYRIPSRVPSRNHVERPF